MSSGGGKTQTTTAASGPPAWAQPYFQAFLNRANESSVQGYQPYTGPRVAGFTDDQLAGFDITRAQALGGNPLLGSAADYTMDTMSGANDFTARGNPYMGGTIAVGSNAYAGQNPYLNQLVEDSQADVTRAYNNSVAPNLMSQFSAGGAYGGSAHQQALSESQRNLADQLGRVSTNLRGADYQNQQQLAEADINRRMQAQAMDWERNAGLQESLLGRQQSAWAGNQSNRMNALGMVPALNSMRYDDARALMNIGSQQQNLWQGLYDQGYQDYVEGRDWEQNQIGMLANALGAVNGGTSTQTGANPNYRSSGQNAAGYAALIASLWG